MHDPSTENGIGRVSVGLGRSVVVMGAVSAELNPGTLDCGDVADEVGVVVDVLELQLDVPADMPSAWAGAAAVDTRAMASAVIRALVRIPRKWRAQPGLPVTTCSFLSITSPLEVVLLITCPTPLVAMGETKHRGDSEPPIAMVVQPRPADVDTSDQARLGGEPDAVARAERQAAR